MRIARQPVASARSRPRCPAGKAGCHGSSCLGRGILWTHFEIFEIGGSQIPWPGLDKAVSITLYNKPYAAVCCSSRWPTGTAILLSAIITAAIWSAPGAGPVSSDAWRPHGGRAGSRS